MARTYVATTTDPDSTTISSYYSPVGGSPLNGKAVFEAIDALDVDDAAVEGQYISQVKEENGKVYISRDKLPDKTIANPTLEGDVDTLTTLQVGDKKYKIEGDVEWEDTDIDFEHDFLI